jgi:biotin transport system substrate-specific component
MAEFALARPRVTEHSPVRQLLVRAALAAGGSALVALCAHLAIPLVFTPVPLSLAPFAVVLLGLVLGPATAFASLCLYLAEGAAGMPVFSPLGPGGVLQLLGPTGGYLLSYPAAAALAGYLYQRPRRGFARGVFSAGTASLLILLAGATWLKALTHMDIQLVLDQAVLPFLPGDVLKVVAAAGSAKLVDAVRLRRELKEFLSREHEL